ncbi:MAG: hypothetical protein H0X59_08020 [Chloroflexi bacterium]|nr:hypothetical protein [Chloroflexota bacterium]
MDQPARPLRGWRPPGRTLVQSMTPVRPEYGDASGLDTALNLARELGDMGIVATALEQLARAANVRT